MLKVQRSTEKEVKFPGVIKGRYTIFIISKSKALLNLQKSWFLTLEFSRGGTQFYRIFNGKENVFLSRISRDKVTNLKDPGVCLDFSGIAQQLSVIL